MFWCYMCFFFFKQKTAYEMRISDWSSDVCSSDLPIFRARLVKARLKQRVVDQRRARRHLPLDNEWIETVESAKRRIAQFAALGRIRVQIGRASCRERVCQYV